VRRLVPFAILGGCLGVGVLPALAADQSVAIHDFEFAPDPVAVIPGESVNWQADGAFPHNVHFEDEAALGPPDVDFSASKQFPTEGEYRYFCDQHGFMRGTVYVNSTGTVPDPTPSPTTSPTASPTASPTSSPGSGGSGGTPGGGGSTSGPSPAGSTTAPVSAFRLRARVRNGRVTLTLTVRADVAVRVRGTLRRGKKRVRSVTLRARPGRHRVRLPGKALKPGRYTLTLRAGDLRRTVRFRVRA
jgi:hypothetical protein